MCPSYFGPISDLFFEADSFGDCADTRFESDEQGSLNAMTARNNAGRVSLSVVGCYEDEACILVNSKVKLKLMGNTFRNLTGYPIGNEMGPIDNMDAVIRDNVIDMGAGRWKGFHAVR